MPLSGPEEQQWEASAHRSVFSAEAAQLFLDMHVLKHAELHNLDDRVNDYFQYNALSLRNLNSERYQAASTSEKAFVAMKQTFDEAYQRITYPTYSKLLNPWRVTEEEQHALHASVHPLVELAVKAWECKPDKPILESPEEMNTELAWMLRVALAETQLHIIETNSPAEKAKIIFDTQKYIIERALTRSQIADETENKSVKADAEDMMRLALNLTAEPGERRFESDPEDSDKFVGKFSDNVLHRGHFVVDEHEFTSARWPNGRLPTIDFIDTFRRTVKGGTDKVNKLYETLIHQPSVGYLQHVMIDGLVAEQAAKIFKTLSETKKAKDYFAETETQTAGPSPGDKLIGRLIVKYRDTFDIKKSIRDLRLSDQNLRQFIQSEIDKRRKKKNAVFSNLGKVVADKFHGQMTSAAVVCQELLDHRRFTLMSQFLDLADLKHALGSSKKGFDDMFSDRFFVGSLVTLLYQFNERGAANHSALFSDELASALTDLGREIPLGDSRPISLALHGSLGADFADELKPGSALADLLSVLKDEPQFIDQLKAGISQNERRNPLHAAGKDYDGFINAPGYLLIEKDADKEIVEQRNQVLADYVESILNKLNAPWAEVSPKITRKMWETQRVMLELLADPLDEASELTIGKKIYVQNKDLMHRLSMMVLHKTTENLSKMLELDEKNGNEKNFDVFLQLASITVPFMGQTEREAFVKMYEEKAWLVDGRFVRDEHWKKFCYAVGLWNPEILIKKQPGHFTIRKPGDSLHRVFDIRLSGTIKNSTLSVVSSWRYIDGITSESFDDRMGKFVRTHPPETLLDKTALRKSAVAQAVNVMRNFALGDDDKKTALDTLERAIRNTVKLSLKDLFVRDLPPSSLRTEAQLEAAKVRYRQAAEEFAAISGGPEQKELEEAMADLRADIENQLKTTTNPNVVLPSTIDLLRSVSTNFSITGNQQNADAIREAAQVSGDAPKSQFAHAVLTALTNALQGSNIEKQLQATFNAIANAHQAKLARLQEKFTQFRMVQLDVDHERKRLETLYARLHEEHAYMDEYMANNAALRQLREFNSWIVQLELHRFELPVATMQEWASQSVVLTSEDEPIEKLQKKKKL